jgi:hypothetical protein
VATKLFCRRRVFGAFRSRFLLSLVSCGAHWIFVVRSSSLLPFFGFQASSESCLQKCSKAEKPESLFLVFGSPGHRFWDRRTFQHTLKNSQIHTLTLVIIKNPKNTVFFFGDVTCDVTHMRDVPHFTRFNNRHNILRKKIQFLNCNVRK